MRPFSFFNISSHLQDMQYTENPNKYVWGMAATRMVMEVQCLAVALIVTSQVWILSYYGSKMFENLIGNDILLPLLYITAVIIGTLTYFRPTYWRIASSLTIYSVCIYFSLLVTTFEIKVLMTPTLTELLREHPENTGVWIPWAIGFAFHMHICITSSIIAAISIRDMYFFEPMILITGPNPQVKENFFCFQRHEKEDIVVDLQPIPTHGMNSGAYISHV